MLQWLGRFLVLGSLCWAQPAAAFAGIGVSVNPDTSYVRIGDVFNVIVRIDSIGTPCSGFENTLAWNGTNLQFLSFQPEELLNQVSWTAWAGSCGSGTGRDDSGAGIYP